MTKKEITKIVMEGATGEYSHCIIYCDHWNYSDNYRYVGYDEFVNIVIENILSLGSPGMYTIEEVYNYNLDLKGQLNEKRAYHIGPLHKTETVIEKKEKTAASQDNTKGDKPYSNISENFKKAIEYASKVHAGQVRLTGEPYINHPLHVVEKVLKYKKSNSIEVLLMSACLHDTIEDTSATFYDINRIFGPQVASLVLELTTDEDMKNSLGKERYLSIKMKNMSSWALVIKLCDRLDNVGDLSNCKDEAFKDKYVDETIGIVDYLIKNAKLSRTHMSIIEEILKILIQLCKGDLERLARITEISDFYYNLKTNFREESGIFDRLMKIADYMDCTGGVGKNFVL